jgi:predicted Zn-dependent protease
LFRKAYVTGDVRAAEDVIPRLRAAIKLAPDDPVGNCSLGGALQWTQQLREARHFLEICVRQRPDSVEDRYRLSQVYRSLGLMHLADEQAAFVSKINRERDRNGGLARKFARELASPRSPE